MSAGASLGRGGVCGQEEAPEQSADWEGSAGAAQGKSPSATLRTGGLILDVTEGSEARESVQQLCMPGRT